MNVSDLVKEIEKLPLHERILVIEKALRSLRHIESAEEMKRAARELREEYKSDKDLTAFTSLDLDDFYETR